MGNYIQPVAPELPGQAGTPVFVEYDELRALWLVYDINHPRSHRETFADKEKAIIRAQRLSANLGVSYCVQVLPIAV